MVESKVHEAHESGIKLNVSQHHPEVNISGHLDAPKNIKIHITCKLH